MVWFYGFKLHIITNHLGEIIAAKLIPANTDDLNRSQVSYQNLKICNTTDQKRATIVTLELTR